MREEIFMLVAIIRFCLVLQHIDAKPGSYSRKNKNDTNQLNTYSIDVHVELSSFFLAMFCPILKTPSLLAFPSPFSVILHRDLWREFWLGIYFSFSIVSKIATIVEMACMSLFWLFLSPRLGANLPQGSFKKRSRSPSVL